MATKKSLKNPQSSPPTPPEVPYAVQVLHADYLRIDVYNMCIPSRTGEPEDGWGSATLSTEQALAFAKEIAAAAVRAKQSTKPMPTKRSKK